MTPQEQKKENLLDSLYRHCSLRSNRTIDVIISVLKDLNLKVSDATIEQLVEVIRPYKQSSKDLENTLNAVYRILYNEDDVDYNSWNNYRG